MGCNIYYCDHMRTSMCCNECKVEKCGNRCLNCKEKCGEYVSDKEDVLVQAFTKALRKDESGFMSKYYGNKHVRALADSMLYQSEMFKKLLYKAKERYK